MVHWVSFFCELVVCKMDFDDRSFVDADCYSWYCNIRPHCVYKLIHSQYALHHWP